ncbi:hypothetical protein VSA01S_06690 [Vibrio sagamiensis NBRC 104589]|uniref:Uncharacterized protein n=1 Tax=Vibrio sagamiensis NBRC 104589 TaxID=1219064 RepID=A0A511QBG5_9VIBR|nr:hypothetical protein VSA01S_06690 [Vibrio sagamiensis NBRC 104589]
MRDIASHRAKESGRNKSVIIEAVNFRSICKVSLLYLINSDNCPYNINGPKIYVFKESIY